MLRIDAERMRADFAELARIGSTPDDGVCRLALSMEDLEARAWFANRIEEAGLLVHDDDAGNLSGILQADDPNARTLLIGSHLDTVLNAGRFDGALGVLAGLECLRRIREAGLKLPVHVEVIDFTDDEGTWHPMFGSSCLTGRIGPSQLREGVSISSAFRAALVRAGINPEHVHRARRDPQSVAGYIELHIEQGWRLERLGVMIGVVTGIVGRSSYQITFQGQSGHAGTASMRDRRDALQGAAQFITRAHALVIEHFPDGVLNCGNLEVSPGALTIIPSEARVMFECRHAEDALLAAMEVALIELAERCATDYRLQVVNRRMGHIPSAVMSERVMCAIETACAQLAVSQMRMASYASHNAQVMSSVTPSGMLFIPSVNGLSHNPAEASNWDDVVCGTDVLLHAILDLALNG